MLKPQALESYVTVSSWRIAECTGQDSCVCARCNGKMASVKLCAPCLVEMTHMMAPSEPERIEERQQTDKRNGIVEWAGIMLLSSCALGLGIILLWGAIQR